MTTIVFCTATHVIASVDSSEVPRELEVVNIRRQDYKVRRVLWTVDNPTSEPQKLRATVELEKCRLNH